MAVAVGLIVASRFIRSIHLPKRRDRTFLPMIRRPGFLRWDHHGVIRRQRTHRIGGLRGRVRAFKPRPRKSRQQHVLIDVQQPLFIEQARTILARRTFPSRREAGLLDFLLELGRALANATAFHSITEQRQTLVLAHHVECVQLPSGRLVCRGEFVTEVVGVHEEGQTLRLEVVQARNALGLRFRPAQRGQQHSGENRDDGNDDEQFDQGERSKATVDAALAVVHGKDGFSSP